MFLECVSENMPEKYSPCTITVKTCERYKAISYVQGEANQSDQITSCSPFCLQPICDTPLYSTDKMHTHTDAPMPQHRDTCGSHLIIDGSRYRSSALFNEMDRRLTGCVHVTVTFTLHSYVRLTHTRAFKDLDSTTSP